VEKKLLRNANLSYKVYLGPHVRLKIRVCLDSSPTKNEQNAEKVPKSCDLGTFLWRRRRELCHVHNIDFNCVYPLYRLFKEGQAILEAEIVPFVLYINKKLEMFTLL
jgi:hypothetical protein